MSFERAFAHDSIEMDQLPDRLGDDEHALVLDVRSRAEYALGHVPGALNAPSAEVARSPKAIAEALPPHDVVYVHCTKGVRSERAVKALRAAGLGDAVLVRDSGFPDWKSKGLEIERGPGHVLHGEDRRPLLRAVAVGIGAGVIATLASGIANCGLSLLVSDRQKRRERRVRRGSPHEIGGPTLFARITGESRRGRSETLRRRPGSAGSTA